MLKDIIKGFFVSAMFTLLVLFGLMFSVALVGTDSLPEQSIKLISLYLPLGVFTIGWILAYIGFKTDINKDWYGSRIPF